VEFGSMPWDFRFAAQSSTFQFPIFVRSIGERFRFWSVIEVGSRWNRGCFAEYLSGDPGQFSFFHDDEIRSRLNGGLASRFGGSTQGGRRGESERDWRMCRVVGFL
jgi:hypothetical protein